MSATALLLSQYVPARDLSVLQLNASNAVSVLLECQDVMCTSQGIAKVNQVEGIDNLKQTIIDRLSLLDPQYTIQVSAHLVGQHIRDLELAKKRARQIDGGSKVAIETLFLEAQSHQANGDLPAYINQFSVQLWNTLMPGNLPDALIQAVLSPVLRYNIELLSTPWVIHSLIAESGSVDETPSTSNFSLIKTMKLLKKRGPNDRNPYFRDLLYQLAPNSRIYGAIKLLLRPFGDLVSILVNRVVANMSSDYTFPQSNSWRETLSTYSSIMRSENQVPSPQRQAWFRRQAMAKVPKLFGTPIVRSDIFDYRRVNQRLIISILDLSLELLRQGE